MRESERRQSAPVQKRAEKEGEKLHATWAQSREGSGPLTRARLYRLDVIFGDIILDPVPVRVPVPLGLGVRVQHLGQGAVPEQTWGQGDLQAEPVL